MGDLVQLFSVARQLHVAEQSPAGCHGFDAGPYTVTAIPDGYGVRDRFGTVISRHEGTGEALSRAWRIAQRLNNETERQTARRMLVESCKKET